MNQADIEKYAFLYFCGEKDRDILLEFEALEHLYEESADIVRDNYISQDQEDLDDTDQQTQWKNDFLRNAVCHNLKL